MWLAHTTWFFTVNCRKPELQLGFLWRAEKLQLQEKMLKLQNNNDDDGGTSTKESLSTIHAIHTYNGGESERRRQPAASRLSFHKSPTECPKNHVKKGGTKSWRVETPCSSSFSLFPTAYLCTESFSPPRIAKQPDPTVRRLVSTILEFSLATWQQTFRFQSYLRFPCRHCSCLMFYKAGRTQFDSIFVDQLCSSLNLRLLEIYWKN